MGKVNRPIIYILKLKMMIEEKYNEKDIEEATQNVNNGMNISEAARKNNIPRQTLSNRIKRLSSSNKGRPTHLSKEEVCYLF